MLSPPPLSPHPRLGASGGGESMLLGFAHTRRAGPCGSSESDSGRPACGSVRAPGPNDRLSVWNQPRSHAPGTVYASSVRHATNQSPPIERTVPSQVHPAAQRRLSLRPGFPRRHGGHALGSPRQSVVVGYTNPRLTQQRQQPGRAAAPSNAPAAASPSRSLPPAVPPGPRNATTRSTASAPTPRSPPSAPAGSPSQNAAPTTGSTHSPAASAATARPTRRSGCAPACCPPG
jgi:hypothetical protein